MIALLGKKELVPAGPAIHKDGRIFLAMKDYPRPLASGPKLIRI
jgi:hypothetical protein